MEMTPATPAKYTGAEQNNINHEEEATIETAVALIEFHKAPFVLNISNSTAGPSSSKLASEGKLAKSRFSLEISQGATDPSTVAIVAPHGLDGDKMTHQAGEIGVVEHPAWFTDEELDGFKNVERVGEDVIQVLCSCKSSRCGHYLGKLRVFRDGRLCVHCLCTPHCDLVEVTPRQFVSHAMARGGPGQWPSLIWVHDRQEGMKRIAKTLLMRYFRMARMRVEKKHKDKFHKDEFMTCSKCGVERRFKLSNAVRCRAYHDATLAENSWTCSMHPFRKIDCNTKAERATRKLVRGCSNGTCGGCHLCSCTGCHMCRYQDCGCKICIDYTRNS